jgi:hypothetical protein
MNKNQMKFKEGKTPGSNGFADGKEKAKYISLVRRITGVEIPL